QAICSMRSSSAHGPAPCPSEWPWPAPCSGEGRRHPMTASPTGSLIQDVMLTLQRLLDADELDSVRKLEVDGRDVYVDLDEPGPPCRQCKRTAREIRQALESLPGVDHAYVALGPEGPTRG